MKSAMIHIHLHFPADRDPGRKPVPCKLPAVPRVGEWVSVPDANGTPSMYVVNRVVHVLAENFVHPVQVHLL